MLRVGARTSDRRARHARRAGGGVISRIGAEPRSPGAASSTASSRLALGDRRRRRRRRGVRRRSLFVVGRCSVRSRARARRLAGGADHQSRLAGRHALRRGHARRRQGPQLDADAGRQRPDADESVGAGSVPVVLRYASEQEFVGALSEAMTRDGRLIELRSMPSSSAATPRRLLDAISRLRSAADGMSARPGRSTCTRCGS